MLESRGRRSAAVAMAKRIVFIMGATQAQLPMFVASKVVNGETDTPA